MTRFTNERTHAQLIDSNGEKERIDLQDEPVPEAAVRDAIAKREDVQRVVLRSLYDVEPGEPEDAHDGAQETGAGELVDDHEREQTEDVDDVVQEENRKESSGDVDEDQG